MSNTAGRPILKTLSPKTLASASIAEKIYSGAKLYCTSVELQARPENVGSVYVGDSTVTTANGIEIPKNAFKTFATDRVPTTWNAIGFDLEKIFIVASNAGDGVRIMVITED